MKKIGFFLLITSLLFTTFLGLVIADSTSCTNTPGAVSLSAPSGTITDNTPALSWIPDPCATWYKLYLADAAGTYKFVQWYEIQDNSANYPEAVCPGETCEITLPESLSPGDYNWWISTWNQYGNGEWSSMGVFTVDSGTPDKIVLSTPSGQINGETPTFTWKSDTAATWYRLFVQENTNKNNKFNQWYEIEDNSANFSETTCDSEECSVTPDIDFQNGEYTWWVRGWNDKGDGQWSEGMVFTVVRDTPPPAKIEINGPSGTIDGTGTTFTWKSDAAATWYRLFVQENGNKSNKFSQWYEITDNFQNFPEATCSGGNCSIVVPDTFSGGTYTWWVRGWNDKGDGQWSDGKIFTVEGKKFSETCGAYIAPGVWKEFDCYNLAAIGKTTGDDPFTPSWRLIGGYWQWGRKGPDPDQWYDTSTENFAHGPTGLSESDANDGSITNWENDYASNGAWSDEYKTDNDPCPAGYRIPTKAQWNGINANNDRSSVGTWWENTTNYSSGFFFGDDLMLPAAGYRERSYGKLQSREKNGGYWSSSSHLKYYALRLNLSKQGAGLVSEYRKVGSSVRCIAAETALDDCKYDISSTTKRFGPNGESSSVSVITSDPGCIWSTSNDLSWVRLSPTNGTGSGNVTILVDDNTPKARTGSVSIAGKTFTISQEGSNSICGAYVAPGVWKEFDCYNLAAIGKTTNDDPFTPSWRLIGGYWQWGRKGPDPTLWYDTNTPNFAHGPTGPGSNEANSDSHNAWDTTYAPAGAWSDEYKTDNDPCPAGYRIPTKAQWNGVAKNNTNSSAGKWAYDSGNHTNYNSALFLGNYLMLPAAGEWNPSNGGSFRYRGIMGSYWSSTYASSRLAVGLSLYSDHGSTGYSYRYYGYSARCIADSNVQDTDTDGDGIPYNQDDCPNDPQKTESGVCGCGTPDTDTDGDGIPDCNDLSLLLPEQYYSEVLQTLGQIIDVDVKERDDEHIHIKIVKITGNSGQFVFSEQSNDDYIYHLIILEENGIAHAETTILCKNNLLEYDFTVNDSSIVNLSSSELLESESLFTKISVNTSSATLDIPKELINRWSMSDVECSINGDPYFPDVIDDDPLIMWRFDDHLYTPYDDNGYFFIKDYRRELWAGREYRLRYFRYWSDTTIGNHIKDCYSIWDFGDGTPSVRVEQGLFWHFGLNFGYWNLLSHSWENDGYYEIEIQIYSADDQLLISETIPITIDFGPIDPLEDSDGDKMPDVIDNCPNTYNPDQADSDGNGIGDACEGYFEPLPIIAAGEKTSFGLNADGSVSVAGNYYWKNQVEEWASIEKIITNWYYHHIVGFDSNGSFFSAGGHDYFLNALGDVSNYNKIIVGNECGIGIRKNGTVSAMGNINFWPQIEEVNSWTDIIDISVGYRHIVGLKSDGTVLAVGDCSFINLCDVKEWKDIKQIAAGGFHTVGLKANGKVVAVGLNGDNQINIQEWTNIKQIVAGEKHTVGLKNNGSVIGTGAFNHSGIYLENWSDIIQIYSGRNHTLGLNSDGKVLAFGDNTYGQCDVSNWDLID